MYSVVLLSGGKGSRMQEDTPKQYLLIAGKPMIMHSLERVDRLVDVDEIVDMKMAMNEKKYPIK